MWRYEIHTRNPSSWKSSALTRYDLNIFIRECEPQVALDDKTAESWILRFLIEKGGYEAKNIENLTITTVDVIHLGNDGIQITKETP
jgi:hypothetical protein